MAEEERKVKGKILVLGDTGTCATGFGTVLRSVLYHLAKAGFEIEQIGINFMGDYYDREKFPYKIYPACPMGESDLFGRNRMMKAFTGEDKSLKPPWDILFTLQDHFILEPLAESINELQKAYRKKAPPKFWFKWISYTPIDGEVKENWVKDSILKADYPVVYTEYGRSEVRKWQETAKVRVIPHGVNIKDFYPLPEEEIKEFRREFFKGRLKKDTFLVATVARNQPRKDLARTMDIFSRFHKARPDSFLYIHAKNMDAGGTLTEIARNFGLKLGDDWSFPKAFNENVGVPLEVLNKIYNAANVLLTTTYGEGWGFMFTEGMACKRVTLAPAVTSIPEIFGLDEPEEKQRGIPIKAKTTTSEWVCLGGGDNEIIRPLANVDDAVEKLKWAYDNRKKIEAMGERAFEWVQGITWDKVCEDWVRLFTNAMIDLEKERKVKRERKKKGKDQGIAVPGEEQPKT